jgi:hypothetical protein
MVEGLYGPIIFGRTRGRIHTFYEIERKYTGRYSAHMVHLRKPLLEWAGNDLMKIDMKIKLNAAWSGDPLPILAEWHLFHENAWWSPLVIGGKPMGPGLSLFVIDEMQENHAHWLDGGRLIAVEVSISFIEYIPFAEGLLSQFGLPAGVGNFFGAGAI